MDKIPFQVSARTAKLIGQENFSNPEGATIELVKNSYDADAKNCLVVFDITWDTIPEGLSLKQFKELSENKIVEQSYKLQGKEYQLAENLTDNTLLQLRDFFFKDNAIYIADNGTGMDRNLILDQWMVIGTGNKEADYLSDDGRVKTGAKGIGRFALDRLGYDTAMWTSYRPTKKSPTFQWKMNWKQFDTPKLILSDVKADLTEINDDPHIILETDLNANPKIKKFLDTTNFSKGTLIKITGLKDNWTHSNLQSVFKSLEALIPPKELSIPFSVHFFHLQNHSEFGEVETAFFNDYDYKILADYNHKDLNVKFTFTRDELDLKKVEKDFKNIFKGKKSPYDLATIKKKKFTVTKSIFELAHWEENTTSKSELKKIGSFKFSFYYLKNQTSQKEEYPFKEVNSSGRKKILDRFGGVKIYRDSFRVRPYGDSGNDWLRLGERASQSPAGAGQRIGDWKVRPNQIAGLINISRIENANLVDKSDRGALVENETFVVFQNVIKAIIGYFELDRTMILNPFYLEGKVREKAQRDKEIREEAEKLADKIVEERKKVEEKLYGRKPDLFKEKKELDEKASYKKIIQEGLDKIESKPDNPEVALIRTLASLGLIVSSFAHELKSIKHNSSEIIVLEKTLNKLLIEEQKKTVEYGDITDIIELLKKDNARISHWIDYCLTAIKKDKRKRSSLKFESYLGHLDRDWKGIFEKNKIELSVKAHFSSPYLFRAFEMDMDTVFNNLIANSIDAFYNLKQIRDRKINIHTTIVKGKLQIIYSDNGTGVPKVFKKKDEIFLPFTTSKKDRLGNDIGTGLGMYLVKSVIEDYEGSVELLDNEPGFKIKIELPVIKKSK